MAKLATTPALTLEDIEAGLDNDTWLGHGYLGERRHQRRAAQDRGDAFLLRAANARGWHPDYLFAFMNSRDGRHFGDLVFGGWDDSEVEAQIAGFFRGW